MNEPILRFEQVSKWFGSVLSLNHVTLELRGGITGLVGANGAGKSTLMKLAVGLLRPSLGKVKIRDVAADDWRARCRVGYCPDGDAFYEEMSGREFVYILAQLNGFPSTTAKSRTEQVLERVGMIDRADRRLRGYSKGMRQRIKLAQALLCDPELLVLDEPLSGIDPIGRAELVELFQKLASQGTCLLISSHELEELEKLTDHVAIMARGRLAAIGTISQIRALLDDQPLTIRIDATPLREFAAELMQHSNVVGLDIDTSITVKARHPKQFLELVNRLAAEGHYELTHLEVLDESAHALLGYLLGGSGKT